MATEAPITKRADKEWYKGADLKLRWTLSPVVDITGWTIKFVLAKTVAGASVLTKTCLVENGPTGLYSVTILDTETDGLTAQSYFYATWRTDAGFEAPLSYGTAELLAVVALPAS